MPCDSITTVAVDLSSAKMQPDLLIRALEALGQSVAVFDTSIRFSSGRYDLQSRQMTLIGSRLTEANIKQAYGAEVLKQQAGKYGWTLRQTAPYKYEVLKR